MSRRLPTYLAEITVPSLTVPPKRVSYDGRWREQPVLRAGTVVAAFQRRQFFGKYLFGGAPQLGITHQG
jgi:hypothetical protein